MPTYVYECKSCGNRMEVIQRVTDPPPTACTSCSGELRKLFFPTRTIFKGTGWHITDYGRNGGRKEPESDTAEKKVEEIKAKTESSGTAKTEETTSKGKESASKDKA